MTKCVDLQGYLQCTKKLYGFGYRIDGSKSDQKRNSPSEEPDGGNLQLTEEEKKELVKSGNIEILPGEAEWIRQKKVIDTPHADQVQCHRGYF